MYMYIYIYIHTYVDTCRSTCMQASNQIFTGMNWYKDANSDMLYKS